MDDDQKNKSGPCSRRKALALMTGATSLVLPNPWPAAAQSRRRPRYPGNPEVPERPSFFFAQLVYGQDFSWNPYPTAARTLMEVLMARTSIPAATDRLDLRASDSKLFRNPFLYWTGTREFDPLPEADVERLRAFLEFGGFMLVDDASSAPGVGFDKAFSRELARLFPGESLARLPSDHTITQSYYLIDRAAGRTAEKAYLSGIERDDRTVLIYSSNDLGGAWAKDRSGNWKNPVKPGGSKQREQAFRLGINVIMYALCMNYKKDLIHTPFISKRRQGRR